MVGSRDEERISKGQYKFYIQKSNINNKYLLNSVIKYNSTKRLENLDLDLYEKNLELKRQTMKLERLKNKKGIHKNFLVLPTISALFLSFFADICFYANTDTVNGFFANLVYIYPICLATEAAIQKMLYSKDNKNIRELESSIEDLGKDLSKMEKNKEKYKKILKRSETLSKKINRYNTPRVVINRENVVNTSNNINNSNNIITYVPDNYEELYNKFFGDYQNSNENGKSRVLKR